MDDSTAGRRPSSPDDAASPLTRRRLNQPSVEERLQAAAAATGTTASGNINAVKHFDAYLVSSTRTGEDDHRTIQSLIAEMLKEDDKGVIGEDVQMMLIDFSYHMRGHVKGLKPPYTPLRPGTKAEYFGKVKEHFKSKIPNLNIWNDDEKWYSALLEQVKGHAKRNSFVGEDAVEEESCRGIVIRTSEGKLRQSQRLWIEHEVGADLESMMKALLKSNAPLKYTTRAKIMMTYFGVGRGGEIKFLRWDEFLWDTYFSCVQGWWKRLKTLSKQQLLFTAYCDGWLCDFYHCFGSYFALEKGLVRTRNQSLTEKKRIFPDLAHKRNESVAREMSKVMKGLSSSVQIKSVTSSRSIRVGGISLLKSTSNVADGAAAYAAGISSNNSTDSYFKPGPHVPSQAANALNDWPVPDKIHVHPPSLNALVGKLPEFSKDALQEVLNGIIANVFPQPHENRLPQFEIGGLLHPFLATCLATFLLHDEDVRATLGIENDLVQWLRQKFKYVLRLSNFAAADAVIMNWGSIIAEDFKHQNDRSLMILNEGFDPAIKNNFRVVMNMMERNISEVGRNVEMAVERAFSGDRITGIVDRAVETRMNQQQHGQQQQVHPSATHQQPQARQQQLEEEQQQQTHQQGEDRHNTAGVNRHQQAATSMVNRINSGQHAAIMRTIQYNATNANAASASTAGYSYSSLIQDLVHEKKLLATCKTKLRSNLWQIRTTTTFHNMSNQNTGHFANSMKLFHSAMKDEKEDLAFLLEMSKESDESFQTNHELQSRLLGESEKMDAKIINFLKVADGKSTRGRPSCISLGKRWGEYLGKNAEMDPGHNAARIHHFFK